MRKNLLHFEEIRSEEGDNDFEEGFTLGNKLSRVYPAVYPEFGRD